MPTRLTDPKKLLTRRHRHQLKPLTKSLVATEISPSVLAARLPSTSFPSTSSNSTASRSDKPLSWYACILDISSNALCCCTSARSSALFLCNMPSKICVGSRSLVLLLSSCISPSAAVGWDGGTSCSRWGSERGSAMGKSSMLQSMSGAG